MYYDTIRQFAFTLKNLDALLTKAEASATARGFDVNNFLAARLNPDMLPFTRQIQIACDVAKSATGSLAGKDIPRHEDYEVTFAELHTRIQKVIDYLGTFRPEDFAAVGEQTRVKVNYPPGKAMEAGTFLRGRAIPNFYFHVTTAYGLLRAGGVPIGKGDFLGDLSLYDA